MAAHAANDQATIDRTITQLSVCEAEMIVYFDPLFSNVQGCPQGSNTIAVIDLENAQGKYMYSSVLSAATAKLKIGLGLSGCEGHPKIYRVDVSYQ